MCTTSTAAFAYNLRFPGQYFDSETGKHYNYNRDYDPATGRYIESDPIGLNGGLNTFGYVKGRPLAWRDPNGLESIPMPGGGAGAALPGWLGDALGAAGRLCTRFPLIVMATMSNPGDSCSDDPSHKRKECQDKENDRCKKAKEECIEQCSDSSLPSGDHGFKFWNCVNRCMREKGCAG